MLETTSIRGFEVSEPWRSRRSSRTRARSGHAEPAGLRGTRDPGSGSGPATELDGLPGGTGLNIAHEAVDRHATARAPITWRCAGSARTGRCATSPTRTSAARRAASPTCSRASGSGRATSSAALAGRIPELYVARARHAQEPQRLQPALLGVRPRADPHAARAREREGARDDRAALRSGRSRRSAASLPDLEHVILVGEARRRDGRARNARLPAPAWPPPTTPTRSARPTRRTSRSSTSRAGRPASRRAPCTSTRRSSSHHVTGKLALDLHPEDVFWCTADPGWVTGTSYGIISPLSNGVTMIVDEAEFDAERWYGILESEARLRLVHGADGDPDDDEDGRRARPRARASRRSASSRASASRSTRPASSGARRRSASPSTTTGGRPRPAGS